MSNNLTDQSQFITTGTSGTNFNIVSSGDTHTFNLPVASATNTGKLSSTDWSTFNEKQAALSFTAPLVNTTNTISIPVATSTVDGYLDNADWVTFNSKQNAITLTTTGTSGASTLVGSTLNIPNYTPDLSGYLPLTGGTLTGALNGTTASFSGAITAQRGNFNQGASSGYAISMKNRNANQEWGLIVDTDAVDDKNLGLYSSEAAMYILRIAASTGAATFFSSITSNTSLTVNRFSNGDYLALKIENRPITAGNNGVGYIGFYSNSGDATSDTYSTGKIYGKFDTNSYNSARLTLSTVTGNNIYQDVLTAKDTNVGIGTINPAQTLHLFTTSSTANGVGTAIQIQSAGTGANQAWVGVNKGTGNGLTFSVENNSIIFNTGASTPFGGTERFRINTTDAVFTNPLSVITNDNNFAFNVQLRNSNTGTQALTGLGISDSSNTRKGQVLWIPSNYVTASLRNSFLVSSVTNVPLILCADATGADTPNIIFQSGATDKMLLNGATGNFSIGNTNNTYKLDVSGTGRFTSSVTAGAILSTGVSTFSRTGLVFTLNPSYAGGDVYSQLQSTGALALASGGDNNRLYITNTGLVGIRTSSPTATLHVLANNALDEGAAAAIIRQGGGNNNNGLLVDVTNSVNAYIADFRQGNSSLVRIIGNGNVGIGTTAPVYKLVVSNSGAEGFEFIPGFGTNINVLQNYNRSTSTWGTLDMRANDYVFRNQGTAALTIASTGVATFSSGVRAFALLAMDGTYQTQIGVMDTDGYLQALKSSDASATNLRFYTGINERMRITSTGNVGIGTSSVNNGISGTETVLKISNSNAASLYLESTSSGKAYANYVGASGNLVWYDLTAATTRMTITSGGNVGIGTSSPNYPLHIYKTSNARLGIEGTTNFAATQYLNSGGSFYIGIDDSAGANFTGTAYGRFLYSSNAYPMSFFTDATERMRITSGGNVLIGSTNGTGKLAVSQSGNEWNTELFHTFSTQYFMVFRYNSTAIGSIIGNGTTTSYNVTSDYRLKEDLKEIKGLEKISAIKVYDFKWKDNQARMDGVLAHELAEVLPYAVTGEKDAEKMQQVDYSKLVPIMIKAIQELKLEIEELKNK